MARDSFSGYLAFDYQAVVSVTFFFISCCSAQHAGETRFCRDCIWTFSRTMEGVGAAEGTDRRRYCGTRCLGKLMNDFPADLAQRPLRIASYLTFTSQPMYRNHGTHHRGCSPRKAPSKKMPVPQGVCTWHCLPPLWKFASYHSFLNQPTKLKLWLLDLLGTFARGSFAFTWAAINYAF